MQLGIRWTRGCRVATLLARILCAYDAWYREWEWYLWRFRLCKACDYWSLEGAASKGTRIGINLTPEIELKYPFDNTAVYYCMRNDASPPPDSYWQ